MVDTPFAITDDIEARWRPLTDAEHVIAETLLADASDMVRDRWSDVDARVLAGTLRASSLTRVVVAMVKRALLNGNDGVESSGQTAGPFGQTVKFANPAGNLYLTADELRLLDGFGKGRAFAVDLSSNTLPAEFYSR